MRTVEHTNYYSQSVPQKTEINEDTKLNNQLPSAINVGVEYAKMPIKCVSIRTLFHDIQASVALGMVLFMQNVVREMNTQSTTVFSSLELQIQLGCSEPTDGKEKNVCALGCQINSCLDILILSSCVWSNQPTIEKQSSNYS